MAIHLDNTLIIDYLSKTDVEPLVFVVSRHYVELPQEQYTHLYTEFLETGEFLKVYRVNYNPPQKRSNDENLPSTPDFGSN